MTMETIALLLVVLVAVFQVLDWLTTREVIARGGYESNPVIRRLIEVVGFTPALLIKGIVVVGVAFAGATVTPYAPAGLCILYFVVIMLNLSRLN